MQEYVLRTFYIYLRKTKSASIVGFWERTEMAERFNRKVVSQQNSVNASGGKSNLFNVQ